MTLILNKSYADSSNELEKTKQEFGSMPIFLYDTNKIGLVPRVTQSYDRNEAWKVRICRRSNFKAF